MQLPAEFQARMQALLGEQYPAYWLAMQQPPQRGLRVNTLKTGVETFLQRSPWPLQPTGLVQEGFLLSNDITRIGSHPLHRAGLFYMQEPSAMRTAALLSPQPGMRVLDLCAAPGGKAGQLAAYLKGEGLLVANELVPARAAVLAGTLERLGVRNALCTCMNPESLCELFAGYFDAVLVDAPCSGEGMFRKEPQAVTAWSVAHVLSCAARQSHILDSAAAALRPGGRLAYSTCTFAPEEDEQAIRAFLSRHPSFALLCEERHYPHTGPGEGHFVALLQKQDGTVQTCISEARPLLVPREAALAWDAFVKENMKTPPKGDPLLLPDGRLVLLPQGVPAGYDRLRLRSAGVHAAEYKNGRFTPAHGLCMAYPASAFLRTVELKEAELDKYFSGNTVQISNDLSGFCVVCAQGYPVGWGKAVQGVLKNHLPKGLRGPIGERTE